MFSIVLIGAVQLADGQVSLSTFSGISEKEIKLLLLDVAVDNPKAFRELATNPAQRKQQLENLRQLFAFASQAKKDGLADDSMNKQELEYVRSEVIAVNYDKELNKNKGSTSPFRFISDARVAAFWSAASTAKVREEEFEEFLYSKTALLKVGNPRIGNRSVSNEEKAQARDFFAKIKIYESEYKTRKAKFTQEFRDKVDLKVKLQQAQFLARLYAEVAAPRIVVTDEEVGDYISGHPELDTSKKKAIAEKILNRAKAGEDFAKLANEYSEDPGNRDSNGKPNGGLYVNIPVGRMVAPFEKAALALRPGELSPLVVETDFGYHIIKLEKKSASQTDPMAQVYDVRHILISTTYTDPAHPASSGKPITEYVRARLEAEKEQRLLDEVVTANSIQVPDDFTVPPVAPKSGGARKSKSAPRKRPAKKRSFVGDLR